MRALGLRTRLLLGFLIVGVLPLAGLAWFYLGAIEQALTTAVLQEVSSIADKKADQVDAYVHERIEDVRTYGQLGLVHNALSLLSADFERGGLQATRENAEHLRPALAMLMQSSAYHDLLLIDRHGNIVFSVRRESDLGTSLVTGPYTASGLAEGFRQAMVSLQTDLTAMEPYMASGGEVAGFLVTPIYQGHEPLGALALQLNLEALTPVVSDRTGLGRSGETVVARRMGDEVLYTGPLARIADAAYRHRSPFEQVAAPMQRALAGGHGYGVTRDDAGVDVVAAWRYLPSLQWGMVVKMDSAEVFLPARQAAWLTLSAFGTFLLLSGGAALLLGQRFFRAEALIKEQEARYRAMFGSMNDGVVLCRAGEDGQDFAVVDINRAAEMITGKIRTEVVGRSITELFKAGDTARIRAVTQRVARSGVTEALALTHYDGDHLASWIDHEIMRLPNGEVLSVFKDITARKHAEHALHLYAKIFEHSGEAILVTDRDNRIIAINPAFTRHTGYTLEDLGGQDPSVLASCRTTRETYRSLWSSLDEKGFWQGELWDRHKDGGVYPKWAAISAIRDGSGATTHHIASFTDIRERKAAEDRIRHLAHHDALTGLFNRYNLEGRLAQALLAARRDQGQLAVMFIDLDRFKVINDSLGHHIGDLLLVSVARRLTACVRESDIVARQGGDEFVVVLTGFAAATDITAVATKILASVSEPFEIHGLILHTSPSIGISLFPGDGTDAETLVRNADTAMYHAKDRGRNNIQYFTARMNALAAERMEMERDLRTAITAKQLSLHYQPKVRAHDQKVMGVEALLRWQHPVHGLILPERFIPIAEETGLIDVIGLWVLQEACRQHACWRAEGFRGLSMAVNVAPRQLRSAQLVEQVRAAMADNGLGEGDLELEITESAAMHEPELSIERLHALRKLGVSIAIDDFGTGYSSLAYLRRLPLQVLKLDRAFVADVEADGNDAAISIATLALAHSLGLQVVAEGVETVGQRDLMVAHDCDLLQGYLFGRPRPASFWSEKWLAERDRAVD
ncbi:MAG TPA: EAL domain-containing protein [Rhodocyclaceae bacterium]|nr:EAL domain-containing protein [Rhodocyclaceae bacterium]